MIRLTIQEGVKQIESTDDEETRLNLIVQLRAVSEGKVRSFKVIRVSRLIFYSVQLCSCVRVHYTLDRRMGNFRLLVGQLY